MTMNPIMNPIGATARTTVKKSYVIDLESMAVGLPEKPPKAYAIARDTIKNAGYRRSNLINLRFALLASTFGDYNTRKIRER